MRRSRLATGFHRIGLILAVPTALCGAGLLGASAFSNDPSTPAIFGGIILVAALLLYAASWAIGWAVRGFMGEVPVVPAPASLGAAALPVVTSVAVPAKQAEKRPLVGFWGWLILPAIGTVVAPFAIAKQAVDLWEVASKITDHDHPIFIYLFFAIVCNCLLMAFDAWALVLMVQKSRHYPRTFIATIIASAVLVTADAALTHWLFNVPIDEEAVKTISRAVVTAAVWVPYMLRSKRVQNTFVN
jgi:hypothetical protein